MDGSIRIGTKLDLSGLKSTIKELEKELKNAQKEADKLTAKEEKAKEAFATEREVDSQMDERFSHREDIDKREAAALEQINAQREELNQKVQEYNAMLDVANAKLQEQLAIQEASKNLGSAIKAYAVLDKIATEEEYNSLLEQTEAKTAAIEAIAEEIAAANGVNLDTLLSTNSEYQRLIELLKVLEATKDRFDDDGDEDDDDDDGDEDDDDEPDDTETDVENVKKGMKEAKKESKGFGDSIASGIKKVGKLALAVFGIRGAYRAVRMAVSEYLSANEQLAGQMDTLKSLFGQVLGPAIEWVVNLLIKAVSAVNAFVNALTGINIVANANAAALKKQSKAGGGNSTAGFDEQTKLSGGGGSGV